MNNAILFLSFTNSQNQSILNCIEYFKLNINDNVDIYLITNTKFVIDGIKESNQLHIKKVDSLSKLFNQLFFRKNKKDIKKFTNSIPSYDKIEILIPHFQNILCNYFLHHQAHKMKSENIIISLYPDGMLSYQPYKLKTRFEYDNLLRWFGGLMLGMHYKVFNGPIADPFGNIKKIYSYLPSITIPYNSEEINKIYFKVDKLDGNNILILGHYKQKKFDKLYLKKLNQTISNFLKKESFNKIYYKPHPRLNKINKDIFYKSIQKIATIKIELCANDQPVEQLIRSVGANKIIASVSTSMINLKLKFKDEISCYYFGLHKYVLEEYAQYYQKVFRKLSIEPLRKKYE